LPPQSVTVAHTVSAGQQSSGTPFAAGQSSGALLPHDPHLPARQERPAQHAPSSEQLAPSAPQPVGGAHAPWLQALLPQHLVVVVHGWPSGVHALPLLLLPGPAALLVALATLVLALVTLVLALPPPPAGHRLPSAAQAAPAPAAPALRPELHAPSASVPASASPNKAMQTSSSTSLPLMEPLVGRGASAPRPARKAHRRLRRNGHFVERLGPN
jgi:hypothetical protein